MLCTGLLFLATPACYKHVLALIKKVICAVVNLNIRCCVTVLLPCRLGYLEVSVDCP
jgi:hypothetical protein